jgi:hypothetical protein
MNAIQFLKKQHAEAKAGFQKIEQGSGKEREQLWKHLSPELKLHEQMEEKHLYGPVSKETKEPALASWPDKHAREVHEAEQLIATLDRGSWEDPEWLDTVKRLHAALEKHIQEEEQDIWPKIERVWDKAQLEKAGERMEAMKAEGGREQARKRA